MLNCGECPSSTSIATCQTKQPPCVLFWGWLKEPSEQIGGGTGRGEESPVVSGVAWFASTWAMLGLPCARLPLSTPALCLGSVGQAAIQCRGMAVRQCSEGLQGPETCSSRQGRTGSQGWGPPGNAWMGRGSPWKPAPVEGTWFTWCQGPLAPPMLCPCLLQKLTYRACPGVR